MEQIAEQLNSKIASLTPSQMAEVERFIESLLAWEEDRTMVREAFLMSVPALEAVWNNPEDDVYNDL